MKGASRTIALASLSILLSSPVAPAYADDARQSDVLVQEQASLDNPAPAAAALDNPAPAAAEHSSPSTHPAGMLSGFVSRRDRVPTGDLSDSQSTNIGMNDASTLNIQVQGQQTLSLVDLMKLARTIKHGEHITLHGMGNGPVTLKLGAQEFPLAMDTPRYSAEEFRKMEYGVTCMASRVSLGMGGPPVVISLLPGGPADTAGIKVGDVLVKADDHVFQSADNQRLAWSVFAGRAGTPIDITVLRNGELLKFKVIRMNIEDIPDKQMRLMYERLLSVIGPPKFKEDGSVQHQSGTGAIAGDSDAH